MSATTPSREVKRLATQMLRLKKNTGTAPYVLVLGADAAPISLERLEYNVLQDDGLTEQEIRSYSEDERTDAFKEVWSGLGLDIRFAILDEAFDQAQADPFYARKLEGYRGLARLCKEGYFDVVLTTNVDTLMEDALINIKMMPREWQVFVNGREDLDKIVQGLKFPTPRLKIVKLHGDLFARVFAFSHDEVFQFSTQIEALLREYLSRSVLIVGNSMRDQDINRCIQATGNALYYVNERRPLLGTVIYDAVRVRKGVVVSGEEAEFGRFFAALSRELLGGDQPEEVGLETLEKVGFDATQIPDEQSDRPLIELLSELQIKKPVRDRGGVLVDVVKPTGLYIRYESDQRLSFKIEGALNYESGPSEVLRLDTEGLNRALQFMGRDIATYHRVGDKEGRDSWRERAKREGSLLYERLIAAYPDLMQKFGMARQATGEGENLVLCFAGPRNHLGMPFELLYDNEPLATRYPLCRQVTGIPSAKPSFSDFLAALRKQELPLRILLIASNTGGIDPDGETQELEEQIRKKAKTLKINAEVKRIPTSEASISRVEKLLNRCAYHIVHYAGHGYFDAATGEDSGLIFWQKPKQQGDAAHLTARALAQRLQGSDTVLFYLSSCVGSTVGGEHLLHSNDYLGVMDAIVQAGVPVVLGYRWYVTDSGARHFAGHFYNTLFETQSPPQAALHARREVYIRDASDETWTSPILVTQKL